MTNPNGKVQLVLAGGGVDVRPMNTPQGVFVWFRDPERPMDVLCMWGRHICTADDVRKHIAASRAKWARMSRG